MLRLQAISYALLVYGIDVDEVFGGTVDKASYALDFAVASSHM